jgi:hypothetical protein
VLTGGPGALVDPVAALKERDAAEGTLFAEHGLPPTTADKPWHPEEAFWIEVKLVAQFCYSAGVPGANRTYTSELLRLPAGDLGKLAREPRVRHGGVLLIMFTADQRTADHDLGVLMHRCLDRELPVRSQAAARFGIVDRIGNSLCSVALVPVRCAREGP